ncbi:hypothetical protein ISN45_Aa01g010510 [Arabidopsis thaliana x Arabidopsis arenosa]|uniref:Uncharacterized protein n=1 Tax=Arabidopsis thaliana x Arabidopsis arenosa TaxID=1240361 RepID=A0A8T2BYU0_9BRAS|nr:hypothetical protein ISN45_Aa01g010510 [Arabidopsis thaliana x Arabidopsis arenosa]
MQRNQAVPLTSCPLYAFAIFRVLDVKRIDSLGRECDDRVDGATRYMIMDKITEKQNISFKTSPNKTAKKKHNPSSKKQCAHNIRFIVHHQANQSKPQEFTNRRSRCFPIILDFRVFQHLDS